MRHKIMKLPEGELEGVQVKRFTVTDEAAKWTIFQYAGRSVPPGEYTRLEIDNKLVMSDTPAEWDDQFEVAYRIKHPDTRRVLINGLGLGMVLGAALEMDHVEHVDVVEIDDRVIRLVGPHYPDPRVTIHHADAHEITWPAGTRWDVVWHDIWPDICEDNLKEMTHLHRRYGRRAGWQGSWGRELLRQ